MALIDQSARGFVTEALVCSGDECDGHAPSVQVDRRVFQARLDGRTIGTTLTPARRVTMES